MPVGAKINGVLYNISPDHLGTPRSIARASDNAEVWRWGGDPFGATEPTGPGGYGLPLVTYNLRFAGQQFEAMTGHHYNWMRDYQPWTGRYLQSDPIGLAGGLSRYAYVGGNPIGAVDPEGLAGVKIGWGGGAAAVRGGSAVTGFYFSPDAVKPAGGYMSLQQEYGIGASLTLFQIGVFTGKGTSLLENSGPTYSFNLLGAGLAVTFGKNNDEGPFGITGIDVSWGPGFKASKTIGEGKTYVAPFTCPR